MPKIFFSWYVYYIILKYITSYIKILYTDFWFQFGDAETWKKHHANPYNKKKLNSKLATFLEPIQQLRSQVI